MTLPTLTSSAGVPLSRLHELGFPDYAAYLQSEHWCALRTKLQVEKPHRWRCEVCETTTGLNVHHRTYRRFGRERPGDLVVLCRAHHEALHRAHWAHGGHWTLWAFGREWIDQQRQRCGLAPLHSR